LRVADTHHAGAHSSHAGGGFAAAETSMQRGAANEALAEPAKRRA
jgi:hypothetical protein